MSQPSRIALDWVDKGRYIEENSTYDITVDNYPASPAYLLNDFLILISDPPVGFDDDWWRFLRQQAEKRLVDKRLCMNCWQFVLLCLWQSGYLEKSHLSTLYSRGVGCRIADLMITQRNPVVNGKSCVPEVNSILFFFDKDIIWHVGIAVENGYVHCLGENVGFNTFTVHDNFVSLPSCEICEHIKDIGEKVPFTVPCPELKLIRRALFARGGYFDVELSSMENVQKRDIELDIQGRDMTDFLSDKELEMMRLLQYSAEKIAHVAKEKYIDAELAKRKEDNCERILQDQGFVRSLFGTSGKTDLSVVLRKLDRALHSLSMHKCKMMVSC